MAALDAGKHVFVEKPLCRTPQELALLREALAVRPAVHLASNLVLRGADLYRWLRNGDRLRRLRRHLRFRRRLSLWPVCTRSRMAGAATPALFGDAGRRNPHDRPAAVAHRPAARQRAGGRQQSGDPRQRSLRRFHRRDADLFVGPGRPDHRQFRLHASSSGMSCASSERAGHFILDDAGPRVLEHRDPPERGMPIAKATPLDAGDDAGTTRACSFLISFAVSPDGAPARNNELDGVLDAVAIAAACDEAAASSKPVNIGLPIERPMRKIPFGKPWITDAERNAVLGVLAGDVLTHGPQAHEFEKSSPRPSAAVTR